MAVTSHWREAGKQPQTQESLTSVPEALWSFRSLNGWCYTSVRMSFKDFSKTSSFLPPKLIIDNLNKSFTCRGEKKLFFQKLHVIFKADPVCGRYVFLIAPFLNFGLISVISKHTLKCSICNTFFYKDYKRQWLLPIFLKSLSFKT